MIPANLPVDPGAVWRGGPVDGTSAAATMLDEIAAAIPGAEMLAEANADDVSTMRLASGAGEIRWADFRHVDGTPGPRSSPPALWLRRDDAVVLKVRLPGWSLRSAVGAETVPQVADLARLLAGLCRAAEDAPREGIARDVRLTGGAYLTLHEPPLRSDSWLGLGLNLPSPWSEACVKRVSPDREDAVSSGGFPRWDAFSSRLAGRLVVTPSVQDGTTTVSVSMAGAPILRPDTVVDAMRLMGRWEGMPTTAEGRIPAA